MHMAIYNIVRSEIGQFNFTANYIFENYKLGPLDLILRIYKSEDMPAPQVEILAGQESFQSKYIVEVRTRQFTSFVEETFTKYPFDGTLDIIIPVCFCDTVEHRQLQHIPCLTFSKTAYSNNILMPSINQMTKLWELDHVDLYDTPFSKKRKAVCFAGSFTGNMSELDKNQRLEFLNKFYKKAGYTCYLTRPPKLDEDSFSTTLQKIKDYYPDFPDDAILNEEKRISIQDQLMYAYQICIDGHTCSWARMVWQLYANVVPIKIRNRYHSWKEWYYPLLDFSKHCLEIDISETEQVIDYLKNNPDESQTIVDNGKEFAKKFLSRDTSFFYMQSLLLELNKRQGNLLYRESKS